MDIKFKPLSNYIVIEVKDKLENSPIVLVNKKNLPRERLEFVVIAVSEEKDKDGNPLVKNVKVGDKIVPDVNQALGTVIKIGKKEVLIMRETQVIGILQDGYENVGETELELLQRNVVVN